MGTCLVFSNLGVFHKAIFINTGRNFSLKFAPEMNKNLAREAKFLNRLIGPSKNKRKLYFEETSTITLGGKLNLGHQIKSNKENSRRIATLNSIFMKQISQLLVTGNISEDVLDKGLEISRVSMNPDFNQLNVFWGTNSEENAAALEAVLPQLGFNLRHELSQLRIVGVVPRIVFMKDKHYNDGYKVDHLLKIADFGEDHVPATLGCDFKNLSVGTHTKVVEHQKTTKEAGTSDKGEETASEEQALVDGIMPVMRQDTFSLDHDRIMKKVMKSIQKSRAYHRFHQDLVVDCDGTKNNPSQTFNDNMTKQERKDAMSKFILDRKILQQKQNQNKYKSELNVPYYGQIQNDGDEYDVEDFETEDYIDEDIFEDNKI